MKLPRTKAKFRNLTEQEVMDQVVSDVDGPVWQELNRLSHLYADQIVHMGRRPKLHRKRGLCALEIQAAKRALWMARFVTDTAPKE